MIQHLRPAIGVIVIFTVLTGLAFPLGFVGIGGAVLPSQAGGSLVERGGVVIGSSLIGQNFSREEYFHPRPSATNGTDDAGKTIPVPYSANNSAGTNMGPTNKGLIDRVTADVAKLGVRPVPGDSVTTSASGLDPNISPENARMQVARVAAARKLEPAVVQAVVDDHTAGRLLGVIGEPRVDVLALNLALDAAGK